MIQKEQIIIGKTTTVKEIIVIQVNYDVPNWVSKYKFAYLGFYNFETIENRDFRRPWPAFLASCSPGGPLRGPPGEHPGQRPAMASGNLDFRSSQNCRNPTR